MNMKVKYQFSVWFSFTFVNYALAYSTTDAGSLYTAVTFGYNSLNRPSETVVVSVDFQLISINYLDTDSQELSVSGWFNVQWADPRFSWAPGGYGNIDEMFLDDSTCWTPKIMVDNSVDSMKLLEDDSVLYRVSNTGEVGWSPPGVLKVLCSVDATYFPYDVHTCYISIRSLTYDASSLTLAYNGSSNNTYIVQDNTDWELLDSYYSEGNITVNSKSYNNVKFYHKLKRKSSYYMRNVIVPFIVTSLVGVLIFLIPVDNAEKIGFGVTILLAQCVLLVVCAEAIPYSSGNTPLLGTYIVILLSMSALEIFIAVINQRIYTTNERNRPLAGAPRTAAMIFAAVTCNRNQNGRYDTESRMETPITPDPSRALKRKPSMITPDNSLNRPNGDMKRARTELAWQRKSICAGKDKLFTAKDLSDSIDRLCFVVFLLFWLVVTIVYMVITSSAS